MQEHVVFRVGRKIIPVIISGHLGKRKPAIFRLPDMTYNGDIMLFQVIKDGIKNWVVDHYKITILIFYNHPDIFPNLNAKCSAIERLF